MLILLTLSAYSLAGDFIGASFIIASNPLMQSRQLLGEVCLNNLLQGAMLQSRWDRDVPLDTAEALPSADCLGSVSAYFKRPALLRRS